MLRITGITRGSRRPSSGIRVPGLAEVPVQQMEGSDVVLCRFSGPDAGRRDNAMIL